MLLMIMPTKTEVFNIFLKLIFILLNRKLYGKNNFSILNKDLLKLLMDMLIGLGHYKEKWTPLTYSLQTLLNNSLSKDCILNTQLMFKLLYLLIWLLLLKEPLDGKLES